MKYENSDFYRWYFIPTDEIKDLEMGVLQEYDEDDFKKFITYVYDIGYLICLEKDDFEGTSLYYEFGEYSEKDTLYNLINNKKNKEITEDLNIKKKNNLYYGIYNENENQVGEFGVSGDYLDSIEIYDEYQNKGYGTEILKKLIKEFGIKRLDVDKYNDGAQRLYERIGFVKIATIYGNVDGDGNDRYIMEYKGNKNNYIIYYQDAFTDDYRDYTKIGWLSENGKKINLNDNEELWEEIEELHLTKEYITETLQKISKGINESKLLEMPEKIDKMNKCELNESKPTERKILKVIDDEGLEAGETFDIAVLFPSGRLVDVTDWGKHFDFCYELAGYFDYD